MRFVRTWLMGLLLFASSAEAKVQMGLYQGIDQNDEPCTVEVRARIKDPKYTEIFSLIVSTMPTKEILNVALVLKRQADPEKNISAFLYAGYRGNEKNAEVLKFELDEKANPISYEYYNNVEADFGTSPVHVKCRKLEYVENPAPGETTVDL